MVDPVKREQRGCVACHLGSGAGPGPGSGSEGNLSSISSLVDHVILRVWIRVCMTMISMTVQHAEILTQVCLI